MERRTFLSFYENGITCKYKWPHSNEGKTESMLRRKKNSLLLKSEKKKLNRKNESEQQRELRLQKERCRDQKRRSCESKENRTKRLQKQNVRDSKLKTKCCICMNHLKKNIGVPDCCLHVFCYKCISDWSKFHQTCPIDRKYFKTIARKESIKGSIIEHTTVTIENRANQNDENFAEIGFDEFDINCHVCGGYDREEVLLLCDSCGCGIHYDTCLVPSLESVPIGLWFCPNCET